MTIGERIKQERKKAGITQKELSEMTHIAEITIRQYEAGKYKPKQEYLKTLANVLEVSPDYLAYGKEVSCETQEQTVGDRIRAYRQSIGLSQAAFGRKIGVAQQQVDLWERNKVNPRYVTLFKISTTFGADIGYLIDGVSQEDKKKIDNGLDATICLLEECGVQLDDYKTEIIHSTLVKMIPSLVGLIE